MEQAKCEHCEVGADVEAGTYCGPCIEKLADEFWRSEQGRAYADQLAQQGGAS